MNIAVVFRRRSRRWSERVFSWVAANWDGSKLGAGRATTRVGMPVEDTLTEKDFLDDRTWLALSAMSARGRMRTIERASAMSALPPKADMLSVGSDVG